MADIGEDIGTPEREEDIPSECLQQWVAYHGSGILERVRAEFQRHGVLWIAFIHGQFASRSWTRRGLHFTRWFVELREQDLVLFGTYTARQWRGRRVNPALNRAALARELREGERAYADCGEWNSSSIRALQRIGFRQIAVMKRSDIWGKRR